MVEIPRVTMIRHRYGQVGHSKIGMTETLNYNDIGKTEDEHYRLVLRDQYNNLVDCSIELKINVPNARWPSLLFAFDDVYSLAPGYKLILEIKRQKESCFPCFPTYKGNWEVAHECTGMKNFNILIFHYVIHGEYITVQKVTWHREDHHENKEKKSGLLRKRQGSVDSILEAKSIKNKSLIRRNSAFSLPVTLKPVNTDNTEKINNVNRNSVISGAKENKQNGNVVHQDKSYEMSVKSNTSGDEKYTQQDVNVNYQTNTSYFTQQTDIPTPPPRDDYFG